jgi:uncharacterized protein YbaP (TraB family)
MLALTAPASSHAESAVWRVSSGESVTYLAGTVHKLPPDQYPLPEEYRAAYDRSDSLVFETDIAAMQQPAVQARIAELSALPAGMTLKLVLDDPAYEALVAYSEEIGFPIQLLEPLEPVPAMLTLLSITIQALGLTGQGVDEYFYARAQLDSKPVDGLETPEQQIDILLSMDQDDPSHFVQRSIEDLREARRGGLETGLRVWRDGDEAALVEHFLRAQMLYSPGLYRSLVVERNLEWMLALRGYFETPETELVLVGVAHLVGEDGLVALLRNEGYEVEKFVPDR